MRKHKGINVYQRKDGRYEARCRSGVKFRSFYGRTSREALGKALEYRKNNAFTALPCSMKFCKLAEEYLESLESSVKISTLVNYRLKLDKHIIPAFGNIFYNDLTAEKINDFVKNKTRSGLSSSYICDIAILLKSICKFTSKAHKTFNPAVDIELPKVKKRERKLLNSGEQKRLQSALSRNKTLTNTGILLALSSGLRLGELCALRWNDIDIHSGVIVVNKTLQRINGKLILSAPKTALSKREIPINKEIFPLLKRFRQSGNCYLLSGTTKPIEPRVMQYRFKAILKKANLPSINFHGLRHMFASNMIECGADVKTLSELLGHSSVNITLNIYVHTSQKQKRYAVNLLRFAC